MSSRGMASASERASGARTRARERSASRCVSKAGETDRALPSAVPENVLDDRRPTPDAHANANAGDDLISVPRVALRQTMRMVLGTGALVPI